MLSTHNLFSPADGRPIVAPAQDMVLGAYFLTVMKPGEPRFDAFGSKNDAQLAYATGQLDLQEGLDVAFPNGDGTKTVRRTTAGRMLFTDIMPDNMHPFIYKMLDDTFAKKEYKGNGFGKKDLGAIIAQCHRMNGDSRTIQLLDEMKALGFQEATKAGMTVAITDMEVPEERNQIWSGPRSRCGT